MVCCTTSVLCQASIQMPDITDGTYRQNSVVTNLGHSDAGLKNTVLATVSYVSRMRS